VPGNFSLGIHYQPVLPAEIVVLLGGEWRRRLSCSSFLSIGTFLPGWCGFARRSNTIGRTRLAAGSFVLDVRIHPLRDGPLQEQDGGRERRRVSGIHLIFPTMVAGPIKPDWHRGVTRILAGLAKKFAITDAFRLTRTA